MLQNTIRFVIQDKRPALLDRTHLALPGSGSFEWSNSYRKAHAFIKANYALLDETFTLNRNRIPAHTTIRDIIQGAASDDLEKCFRKYSNLLSNRSNSKRRFVAFDGKVLRGSFDHFCSQTTIQALSAFLTG